MGLELQFGELGLGRVGGGVRVEVEIWVRFKRSASAEALDR